MDLGLLRALGMGSLPLRPLAFPLEFGLVLAAWPIPRLSLLVSRPCTLLSRSGLGFLVSFGARRLLQRKPLRLSEYLSVSTERTASAPEARSRGPGKSSCLGRAPHHKGRSVCWGEPRRQPACPLPRRGALGPGKASNRPAR